MASARVSHSVASATGTAHFPQFIRLEFSNVLTRNINPYEVIDKISEATGESPLSLSSESRNSYTIKTTSRNQAVNILTISSIQNTSAKHPYILF